jgi:2,3-bisphosphoglycerate-independent phosphoglycerate mutase
MKPVVLLIRDGWGYREQTDLNAPIQGNTKFTDYLMGKYPHTLLGAAGTYVGLLDGYQGNSEVGHMTIGAGKIFFQSLVRINKDINNGTFFENKKIVEAIENCKKNNSILHLCGLLQKEGVHSHIDHCFAILELCKRHNFNNVYIHVITDGRDSPVKNSIKNLRKLLDKIKVLELGEIASISGRYYAMDRDKRWDRTKKAYDVIALGNGNSFKDPIKYLEESYNSNITDEFIIPKKASCYSGINKNDSFIFFNFRSDRPRQITQAIIENDFEGFNRKALDVKFYTMTEYYKSDCNNLNIIYESELPKNTLGEVISENNINQLRISETEKYAHVTFFFNGQNEKPFPLEDRILIPSPKIPTYDLKPEMSVYEIKDRLIEEIDKDIYQFIVVNLVNGDMVGHTGSWEAVLKAVESVDKSVEEIVNKVLEKDGHILIFGDHGNCEDMTEKWRTSHTTNKVPLIFVSNNPNIKLKDNFGLKDIAPTVLKILDIDKPEEMSGESIF